MTVPRKRASGRANAPAVIIVNNLDHPVRYAAWFGNKRARAAVELVEALGYHALNVDTLPLEEMASRLSEGFVIGRNLTLAIVSDDLARELEAIISARQPADSEATQPRTHDTAGTSQDPATRDASADSGDDEQARLSGRAESDDWTELQAGALVLAADLDRYGAAEAWYEAIIVRKEGRELVLRWRDFPRDGLLTRTRRHIAIPCPVD